MRMKTNRAVRHS